MPVYNLALSLPTRFKQREPPQHRRLRVMTQKPSQLIYMSTIEVVPHIAESLGTRDRLQQVNLTDASAQNRCCRRLRTKEARQQMAPRLRR